MRHPTKSTVTLIKPAVAAAKQRITTSEAVADTAPSSEGVSDAPVADSLPLVTEVSVSELGGKACLLANGQPIHMDLGNGYALSASVTETSDRSIRQAADWCKPRSDVTNLLGRMASGECPARASQGTCMGCGDTVNVAIVPVPADGEHQTVDD